jgi:hypothetical protein
MTKPTPPRIFDLAQIVQAQWQSLSQAAHDRHHAWHTPTLANVGEGIAQVRTVVLRSADPDTRILTCHADSRSPKITQLAQDPCFSWHFYDRDAKVQLRAYGRAWIHQDDALTHQRWRDGAWRSAQCYRTPFAPGAPCTETDLDIDEAVDPATGEEHFVVLACEINMLDWLYLHVEGHRRAQFSWQEAHWQGQWIAP